MDGVEGTAPMLVSILIPTRKRVPRLLKLINSIYATASNPKSFEIILKVDPDDDETLNATRNFNGQVVARVTPRGIGYGDSGRYCMEMEEVADGDWCFLIDDDSTVEGKGWDEQIAALPKTGVMASCEFYRLGSSGYGSGSCGVVGPWWPRGAWKQFDKAIATPPDLALHTLFTKNGWQVHLLKGITYNHDRDPGHLLEAHRKL